MPVSMTDRGTEDISGSLPFGRRDFLLGGAALAVAREARGQAADAMLLRVDATGMDGGERSLDAILAAR